MYMKKYHTAFSGLHSDIEKNLQQGLLSLLKESPIPDTEFIANLPLFLRRQDIARILFMDYLYREMIGVHGVIAEFGIRWGRNLPLLESLRGIYEPYNYNRKILGFDTFQGFPNTSEKDGKAKIIATGTLAVSDGYDAYLGRIMDHHESGNPVSHIKKYELVKGDASISIKKYLKDHPETIFAFAYFDFDLYEPTKNVLKAIKGHLTKGSVIAFDEVNHKDFPGETLALKEVLGLDTYHLCHNPYGSAQSYLVIE
mgnify:FL=1